MFPITGRLEGIWGNEIPLGGRHKVVALLRGYKAFSFTKNFANITLHNLSITRAFPKGKVFLDHGILDYPKLPCFFLGETLCLSGKSLDSLRHLSPPGKVICMLSEETTSPLGKTLDLSGKTFIKPSDKTLGLSLLSPRACWTRFIC